MPEVVHNPRYAYDCENCKFTWCCGPTCHCTYTNKLPEPPRDRQDYVDQQLVQCGLSPQFHGKDAQRR